MKCISFDEMQFNIFFESPCTPDDHEIRPRKAGECLVHRVGSVGRRSYFEDVHVKCLGSGLELVRHLSLTLESSNAKIYLLDERVPNK